MGRKPIKISMKFDYKSNRFITCRKQSRTSQHCWYWVKKSFCILSLQFTLFKLMFSWNVSHCFLLPKFFSRWFLSYYYDYVFSSLILLHLILRSGFLVLNSSIVHIMLVPVLIFSPIYNNVLVPLKLKSYLLPVKKSCVCMHKDSTKCPLHEWPSERPVPVLI